MITEQDLKDAIAECQGVRNPGANTCIKLAAYYTILNQLYGNQVKEESASDYSFSTMPAISDIKIEDIPYTDSEFSLGIRDKGINKVFPILEDLMDTLSIINPRLYDSVMKKIFEL